MCALLPALPACQHSACLPGRTVLYRRWEVPLWRLGGWEVPVVPAFLTCRETSGYLRFSLEGTPTIAALYTHLPYYHHPALWRATPFAHPYACLLHYIPFTCLLLPLLWLLFLSAVCLLLPVLLPLCFLCNSGGGVGIACRISDYCLPYQCVAIAFVMPLPACTHIPACTACRKSGPWHCLPSLPGRHA